MKGDKPKSVLEESLKTPAIMPDEQKTWLLSQDSDADAERSASSFPNDASSLDATALRAFNLFDADGSGFITVEEFEKLVNYPDLLPHDEKLTDQEIREALAVIDVDVSGTISWEEFRLWFTGKRDDSLTSAAGAASNTSYSMTDSTSAFIHAPPPPAKLDRVRSGLRSNSFWEVFSSFGMSETFYCSGCMANHKTKDGIQLKKCRHRFCKSCIYGWVCARVEVSDVCPKCFQIDDDTNKQCGTEIHEGDVRTILHWNLNNIDNINTIQEGKEYNSFTNTGSSTDTVINMVGTDNPMLAKFEMFKQFKAQPNTRECSKCGHLQVGSPEAPEMTCEECAHAFCFHHAESHDGQTCDEFKASNASDEKTRLTNALISKISKPCPKCTAPIEKRSGCNHMKCASCSCSFCWLCLQEIEDTPTPPHYRMTNIGGCPGKQFEGQGGVGSLLDAEMFNRFSFGQRLYITIAIVALVLLHYCILSPLTLLATVAASIIQIPFTLHWMLTEHGTCCVFDAWWTLMQGRYQRWYNFWISISLVVCCIPGCFLVLCPVILLGIPETIEEIAEVAAQNQADGENAGILAAEAEVAAEAAAGHV